MNMTLRCILRLIVFSWGLLFPVFGLNSPNLPSRTNGATYFNYDDLVGLPPSLQHIYSKVNHFLWENDLNITENCRNDVQRITVDLQNGEEYAFQIEDSYGRRPAGLFLGNSQWWGAYDQCRDTHQTVNGTKIIQAEYCMAMIQTTRGNIHLGVCVPDSCSTTDVTSILENGLLGDVQPDTNVVQVNCVEEKAFSGGDVVALFICSFLGLLVLSATIYEICMNRNKNLSETEGGYDNPMPHSVSAISLTPILEGSNLSMVSKAVSQFNSQPSKKVQYAHESLISFSLMTNVPKLLNTQSAESNPLTSLHGIRVLTTLWVILGHVFRYMELVIDNSGVVDEKVYKSFTHHVIISSQFSVDSFFLLSGFLVSYFTLKSLKSGGGKTNWFKFYFHRFWRLTPAYMIALMLNTTLLRWSASGPLQFSTDSMIKTCQKYWWTNLLYINNFYPMTRNPREMCFGISWYLANDTQMFVISPVIILLLYKYWKAGVALALAFILMNLGVTGGLNTQYELQPLFFYTPEKDGGVEVAGHIYMWFYHRIAPYVVGILLAFLLFKTNCEAKIKKIFVPLGWVLSLAVMLSVMFGLYGYYSPEFKLMEQNVASLYESTHHLAWALGLAWIVFACVTGYGGIVCRLLSWRAWVVLARLSYSAYLMHQMVNFTYYFTIRTPINYTDYNAAYIYTGTTFMSYLFAVVLVLTVEMPFTALEKVFLQQWYKPEPEVTSSNLTEDSAQNTNQDSRNRNKERNISEMPSQEMSKL